MNICRRRIFMLILAVLSAGVIRMPRAAAQELIVNGGFEEPALDYEYWDWFWSVPGWNTFADGVEIQNHVAGSPHQGAQHIELDTYTPSGITQDVPTQGGATYQLTFAYSPRPGVADNAIQVWWNGEVIATLNRSGVDLPDTDWTVHSYNLAGTAPTSHLEFRDAGTPDGVGGYIDTVSLVGVNVVVNPTFAPPGGAYANTQVVTLTCATPGAVIHYTTDGSLPGPTSPVAPSGTTFLIDHTGVTLRAYATRDDLLDSGVTDATYALVTAAPIFTPRDAPTPVTVSMTSETIDSSIYYTIDGSDPAPEHGQLYTGPILVTGTTTLRAVAVKAGFLTSKTTSVVYQPRVVQDLEWRQRMVTGPSDRSNTAMAYDSARGVCVLFGGNNGESELSDTWEWSGSGWTQRLVSGPAARNAHSMAYDSVRGLTVLFGGTANAAETWEWDGTTWARRNAATSQYGAIAYDAARGVSVRFDDEGDTWEWDGTNWVQRKVAGPPSRFGHQMAYDTSRRVTVLFGGTVDIYADAFSDTWEWDGTNWTQRVVVGPSGRLAHKMAYDASREVTVLYGGFNFVDGEFVANAETWEWDGTSWTQRMIAGPFLRAGHAMAYDAARRATVLFGGGVSDNATWELLVRCRADFNNDGRADSLDFFDFLTAFFGNNPAADFNADGHINSQDFFDFLTAFFVGCA